MDDANLKEKLTPGAHPTDTSGAPPYIGDMRPQGKADAVIFLGRKIGAAGTDKDGFPINNDFGKESRALCYLRPGDRQYMAVHGLNKGTCRPSGWRIFATRGMLETAEKTFRTLEALFSLHPQGIEAIAAQHCRNWTWHEVEEGIWAGVYEIKKAE